MVLESADPDYFIPHVDLTKVAEYTPHVDLTKVAEYTPHVDLTKVAEYTAEAAKAGGPGDASLGMLWHKLSELPTVTIAKIRGRASGEFRAVLAEELGYRARGAAGDLLEGAGRVVVLAGEDRPLARDEQLSRPRRYPGAGEAVEELPLCCDQEGDGLAEFGRQQLERLRP